MGITVLIVDDGKPARIWACRTIAALHPGRAEAGDVFRAPLSGAAPRLGAAGA